MSVDYNQVGYVIASDYRRDVLVALSERPATPSTIAEQVDRQIAHVSRALTELRERDLVELLVDEDMKKGRIYGLTDEGEDALEGIGTVGGGA